VDDVVEFLRALEPFMELDESALAELAGRAEVELFGAGEVIFRQGEPGLRHVRVIRRGSVELVDGGRVLDLLGEGEWFGHPSMLSGLPTSAAARAAEDTLCYRLAAEDVLPLLARPTGLRFLARSLMARPRPGVASEARGAMVRPDLPAHALIHEQLVLCASDVSIRDAARRMADARASCALVALPSTGLGILTDHDLRVRVVADGVPTDAPISAAMSAPAFTVGRDELGSELMLAMIDRGVRHLPVISDTGDPIGVVTDVDLLAAEARTPLIVRRAIEEARDVGEVREAAERIPRGGCRRQADRGDHGRHRGCGREPDDRAAACGRRASDLRLDVVGELRSPRAGPQLRPRQRPGMGRRIGRPDAGAGAGGDRRSRSRRAHGRLARRERREPAVRTRGSRVAVIDRALAGAPGVRRTC
jgi:signal-transduction protein with cAMP-binding, CBS, and nucleotidyltransferase domain